MSGYAPLIIFSIMMAGAITWMVVASRRGSRLWRPKNPRSVALIKIALWSGLMTWAVFTLATGIVVARAAAILLPQWIGISLTSQIWTWVVPIWIVFTTLMLIWAVINFANKRLRRGMVEEWDAGEKKLKTK